MDYRSRLLEVIIFFLFPQGVYCYDQALLGLVASSVVAGVFFILIVVMAIMVTIWEDIEVAKGKVKIPRRRYSRFRVHTPESMSLPPADRNIEMTNVPKIWSSVPTTWTETGTLPRDQHQRETEEQQREFYFTQATDNQTSDPATLVLPESEADKAEYDYRSSLNRMSDSTNRLSGSTNRLSGSTNRISGTTMQSTLPMSAKNHKAYSATRLSNSNLSQTHSEVLLVPGSEMTDGNSTIDRMTDMDEKITSF